MLMTLVEDFSTQLSLDSELLGTPSSGYFLNSGVHPYITVENLISFLPNVTINISDYNASTTYSEYTDSLKLSDVVQDNGVIYQSLVDNNTGNALTDDTKWLVTNIDSLRIKSFVLRSQQAAIQKLNLTRRLVDNQYLYNVVEPNRRDLTETMLPNDYAGWCFEPKGSDYVKIRINEVALQATTATPQSMYVVNQGQLIDTLTLNPNADGRLVFEEINYTVYGKGIFFFVIDSQNVLTNGSYVDPLKYNGFTACTCVGIGSTPEDSAYSLGTSNNGLSFNVTATFDGLKYIENNLVDFGDYLQAQWQIDVLNHFLSNPNTRSNNVQRSVIDRQLLLDETKLTNVETAAKRLKYSYKKAKEAISISLDTELDGEDGAFTIEISSI